MAKNSVVVSYRRFEDELDNHGVKFLRWHNGGKEVRTYKNLTYSSYWRMVTVTDKLYDDLCKESDAYQYYISYVF